MKRSKILLEKVEERKDDLMEYLELLSYIEDDEEERIDEFEEEDLMEQRKEIKKCWQKKF